LRGYLKARRGSTSPILYTVANVSSFLLVEFQLNHILQERDPRDAIDRLNALPADLPAAYQDVLKRIERNGCTRLVQRILSWLFHAFRPLKMNELREAISVRLGDRRVYTDYFISPDVLIESCENLVEMAEFSGIVRFTHYTVQEFLEKNYVDNLLSKVDISRMCLTYLNFDSHYVNFDGPCLNFDSPCLNCYWLDQGVEDGSNDADCSDESICGGGFDVPILVSVEELFKPPLVEEQTIDFFCPFGKYVARY